jgi:hypothetical protein
MTLGPDFPRLTPDNARTTSPPSPDYNCVAWAVGDTEHWWQPGVYWPIPVAPDAYGISALAQALRAVGFEPCADGRPEAGYDKVALYSDGLFYTHAARQLPNGRWTSKLGRSEDIEHDTPDAVAGGAYGEVVQFLRRAVPSAL